MGSKGPPVVVSYGIHTCVYHVSVVGVSFTGWVGVVADNNERGLHFFRVLKSDWGLGCVSASSLLRLPKAFGLVFFLGLRPQGRKPLP